MFAGYRRALLILPYVKETATNFFTVSNVTSTPSFATRFALRRIDKERKGLRRERDECRAKMEEAVSDGKRRKKKMAALMEKLGRLEEEKRGVMGELESTKRLLDERQERSRAAVENMYRQIVGVG